MTQAAGAAETSDAPLPRVTADLLGQQAAERQMLEAALSGRLPHAWLLTGPAGIGKATLAYRFARFLLAGGADAPAGGLFGDEPTDMAVAIGDQTARLVAGNAHPDLLVIERPVHREDVDKPAPLQRLTRDLPVEEVRRIGPFLSLTPAISAWRVVVVDGADGMNRSAANAVLKLLEEPPARAVILMTSDSPGRLLPTIRSRCRVLSLAALADRAVVDWLSLHQPDLGDTDRLTIARLAEGSLGRAGRLARAGGLALFRELIALLEPAPGIDMDAVGKLAARLGPASAEAAYRLFIELFRWWLARLIGAIARGQVPPEAVAGEAALLSRLAAGASLERWMQVWDKTGLLLDRADSANLDRGLALIETFICLRGAFR